MICIKIDNCNTNIKTSLYNVHANIINRFAYHEFCAIWLLITYELQFAIIKLIIKNRVLTCKGVAIRINHIKFEPQSVLFAMWWVTIDLNMAKRILSLCIIWSRIDQREGERKSNNEQQIASWHKIRRKSERNTEIMEGQFVVCNISFTVYEFLFLCMSVATLFLLFALSGLVFTLSKFSTFKIHTHTHPFKKENKRVFAH